jgi:tol-pal system protein YbgF
MTLRTVSGTLLAVLASAAIGHARDGGLHEMRPTAGLTGIHAPSAGLPGVFPAAPQRDFIQLAQASDPRVVQLEEQIRALNGTVEELNFQILQLQEQLRKMQEDNEFRFQELEKRSDAGKGRQERTTASTPAEQPAPAVAAQPPAPNAGSIEDVIAQDTQPAPTGPGEPPKTFGSITFDANGNVVGGEATGQQQAAPAAPAAQDGTVVAALPSSGDPEELYRSAYQFVLSGDYKTAEAGFREHAERFPDDERAPDVQFWLGEALLGQSRNREAAEVFLNASNRYPASTKGPDMLLKLGVSLAALKQKDVACATLSEVNKRYPNASAALKGRVKEERSKAAC